MKSLLIICFCLVVALAFATGYLFMENRALSAEVKELAATNEALEARVTELEEKSLSGVMEQAGEAIVDGWGMMLESVEEELEKAHNALEEQRKKREQQRMQQSPQPNGSPEQDDNKKEAEDAADEKADEPLNT